MQLKIACYGLISETLGSVEGANLLLIRALLAAGHVVRLYNFTPMDIPADLEANPQFSFECVAPSRFERLGNTLSRGQWNLEKQALLTTFYMPFRKQTLKRAVASHPSGFDVLLYLGYPAFFRLKRGNTISWYQGPLQSESNAIAAMRQYIVRFGGWRKYLTLRLGYRLRLATIRLCCEPSDVVICCSEWSKAQISSWALQPERIAVVPYPIDLTLFAPRARLAPEHGEPIFLWLGRSNPRKRLDLMVAAFELYRSRHGKGRLKVVGRYSYLPGQARMLRESAASQYIDYESQIARPQIPALLASVDVLVQPSELENFGSSVAEALASGVPTVTGVTNGTNDYLGECGFVFERYTAESVYDAMVRATAVRESESYRLAARELAERNFAHHSVAQRLIEIITSLTARP